MKTSYAIATHFQHAKENVQFKNFEVCTILFTMVSVELFSVMYVVLVMHSLTVMAYLTSRQLKESGLKQLKELYAHSVHYFHVI